MLRKKYKRVVLIVLLFISAVFFVFGIVVAKGDKTTADASGVETKALAGYGWDIVPVEEVVITKTGANELRPGESVDLGVLLTPEYAFYTVQNIRYEIINGSNIASIDQASSILTVNANADKQVGNEVKVRAIVDGITSTNILTFNIIKTSEETINTHIKKFEILSDYEILDEENQYEISEIITTDITTDDALPDESYIQYNIIFGSNFAWIENDSVLHINSVDAGNRFFILQAKVGGVLSNYLTFDIYAKTTTIKVHVENSFPMSSKEQGDRVNIMTYVDIKATIQTPTIRVLDGANLILGNYKNGDIIESQFDVISNAARLGNKDILIEVSQDGIKEYIDIEVYIPVEDAVLKTYKHETINGEIYYYIKRGTFNELTSILTNNATLAGVSDDYGNPNWSILNFDIAEEFDISGIKVPQNTPAGTLIVVEYQSRDRLGNIFTARFIVDKLTVEEQNKFMFKVGDDGKSLQPYDKDSEGVKISSSNPQLWINRSTDIIVTYNGIDLSSYGFILSDGGLMVTKLNDNTARLTMSGEASGNYVLKSSIIISDGTGAYGATYTIELPEIKAFRPMSGTPVLKGAETAMVTSRKELELEIGNDWDHNATYGLDKIVFWSSSTFVSIESNRYFNIISNSASASQIIILRSRDNNGNFTQFYNGIGIDYLKPDGKDYFVTQAVKRIILNENDWFESVVSRNLGSVLAVDAFGITIPIPVKDGYIFAGYYTGTGQPMSYGYVYPIGDQYYNSKGELIVTHSSYTNEILYARWTKSYTYNEDDFKDINTSEQCGVSIFNGSGSYQITYSNTSPDGVHFYPSNNTRITNNDFDFIIYKDASSKSGSVTMYITDTILNVTHFLFFSYSTSGNCVAEGTLITLADGTQKAVEDLDGSEMLLVWNLHTGTFDIAPILFIDSDPAGEYEIIRLYFSDGTDVKVISEHAFWDFDLNEYVFLRADAAQYIGHWFNKQITNPDGTLGWIKVQLIDVEIYTEYTTSWSPVTFGHLCYYVNGMLSMPGATEGLINIFEVDSETMQIDQEKYLEDIETYGLLTYEYFEDLIPEIIFEAFQGQYLAVSMGKGLLTQEQLVELIEHYSKFFIIKGDE